MVTVELTDDEAALVRRSLELFLSDLRMEICDTERADFRDGLKQEKSAIQHLLAQLGQSPE